MKATNLSLLLAAMLGLGACSSDSDDDPSPTPSPNGGESANYDLIVSTMLDATTGYVNAVDGSKTSMDNSKGIEVNPSKGVFARGGYVYVSGSMTDNNVKKLAVNDDGTLSLVAEIDLKEDGVSIPTSFIFVDDSRAYVPLAGAGELIDLDLDTFTVRDRIDLSDYAMDENQLLHKDGGTDTNPEPSAGVIRDGKLFLGLGQVNFLGHTEGAFLCRGKASVLILDVATNTIDKHIDDNRTCTSGSISPGSVLSLSESGDIYVNNTASFGYDPSGIPPGYLRIKAGETDFDPDYFFNIGELDLRQEFPEMDPSLAKSPYVYKELMSDGKLYATMLVLGLTTGDPNDFIGNKNYQPFELDLENQTATKLDMLPTNGWSAQIAEYNGEVVFAESTVDGNGLYKLGQKTPFLAIEGFPVHVAEVD